MTTNKLMLNENKTEVICISSNYFCDQVSINQFSVDDTMVVPASSVRNIGVMFDNTMSMMNQVTSLCKAAHFHLRNIGQIRKSITYEACEKLIHALITSRLDYCIATLYGITEAQHHRRQKMFNIAARILTLTPPSDDIETVLLGKLHWLPVQIVFRITFSFSPSSPPRACSTISRRTAGTKSQSGILGKQTQTDCISL